jgi:hypothetical protein
MRPGNCRASAASSKLGEPGGGQEQEQCRGVMNFTELSSVPSDRPVLFTDQLRLAVAAYLVRSRAPPASTPNPTCAPSSPGALIAAWTRCPCAARTWSCTSGGCRRSAGSSPGHPSHQQRACGWKPSRSARPPENGDDTHLREPSGIASDGRETAGRLLRGPGQWMRLACPTRRPACGACAMVPLDA